MKHCVARDYVARKKCSRSRVLSIIAVHHGLHEYGRIARVLLVEANEAGYTLESDFDLNGRRIEETLRKQGRVLVHERCRGLRRFLGPQGLGASLGRGRDGESVFIAAFELRNAVLDREHAADEEQHLMGGEVGAHPRREAFDGVAGETEIVQCGIIRDGQVRRDDDLEQQRVSPIAELFADDLFRFP